MENGDIVDRYAVDQSPKVCGFGAEPGIRPDDVFDLLYRELFLKPCDSLGITQFQNTFDGIFRVGLRVKRLHVDIPEI